MPSILQDWVQELGLRHQGVLVSAVRGCDVAPRDDASKQIARLLRGAILRAHVGDPSKAKTFIGWEPDVEEFHRKVDVFLRAMDHYPLHYVIHLLYAAEIIGYKHPNANEADRWWTVYSKACKRLHLTRESEEELDSRLNKNEDDFKAAQDP